MNKEKNLFYHYSAKLFRCKFVNIFNENKYRSNSDKAGIVEDSLQKTKFQLPFAEFQQVC